MSNIVILKNIRSQMSRCPLAAPIRNSLPIQTFFLSIWKCFLKSKKRHKTISTIKKEYVAGGQLLETPEGCYLDLVRNAHELLSNYCDFQLPDFDENGPSFIF